MRTSQRCCPGARGQCWQLLDRQCLPRPLGFSLQYTYSGLRLEPERWHRDIAALKRQVEAAAGATFNSCLLNFYRRWAGRLRDEPGCAPLDPAGCGHARRMEHSCIARSIRAHTRSPVCCNLPPCLPPAPPPGSQRRRLHRVAQRQRAAVRRPADDCHGVAGRPARVPAAPQRRPPRQVPLPPGRRRAASHGWAGAGAGGCRAGAGASHGWWVLPWVAGGCCGWERSVQWVAGAVIGSAARSGASGARTLPRRWLPIPPCAVDAQHPQAAGARGPAHLAHVPPHHAAGAGAAMSLHRGLVRCEQRGTGRLCNIRQQTDAV